MRNQITTPPVKEGQIVDVKVMNKGDKGDGIAKYNGYVLIVPDGRPGSWAKVKVTKTLPNYGFAEIIQNIEGG